ncbi:MAG: DUF3467 domain-containing protein [Anaerolineales bacterium]|jgi:hypothetical protein
MPEDAKKEPSRLPVHVPPELKPTYANFALITHSRSEIVIDFALIMPQSPQAKVQNRIVMTAFNAKLLSRALNQHISRFEAQHGEIDLPEGHSLANQLFKPSTPDEESDE